MDREEIIGMLHPHRRRFDTHDVTRSPVTLSPQAKEWVLASSAQGRLFPQALSEVFGQLADLEGLVLDLVPLHHVFPGDSQGEVLMQLEVQRAGRKTYLHIEALALCAMHTNGHPAFVALDAAQELLRVDQMRRGK